MSQQGLNQFLAQVRTDPALQGRLSRCTVVEAAALAQALGCPVCCGDLLRYESRAFAWQLSDAEYELVARLQRPRRHWWQTCWPPATQPDTTGLTAKGACDGHGRADSPKRRPQSTNVSAAAAATAMNTPGEYNEVTPT